MFIRSLTVLTMLTLAAGSAVGQCCGGGGGGGHGGHGGSGGAGGDGHNHVQPASDNPAHVHGTQDARQQAINRICPVGREPIDGRSFITYEGNVVGFCCPGCDGAFLGWEKGRRDHFITAVKEGGGIPQPPVRETPAAAAPGVDSLSFAYPLKNCPVSGEPLGSMGEPVVKTYDGREVRFCCAGCEPQFEAEKDKYFASIDEQIIAMQLPYYPLETCIVAGGALGSMGEPDNFVYNNRLVRFCCAGCRDGFKENAAEHLAALDEAAADEQRQDYPFDTCIVRGNKLGSMGDPAEVILAGRLVRLCCPPCERELRRDPAKFTAQLDEAWERAGRPGLPLPSSDR